MTGSTEQAPVQAGRQGPFNLGGDGGSGSWGNAADVEALWDELYPPPAKPRRYCTLACGCRRPVPARFGPAFRCTEHGLTSVTSVDGE